MEYLFIFFIFFRFEFFKVFEDSYMVTKAALIWLKNIFLSK